VSLKLKDSYLQQNPGLFDAFDTLERPMAVEQRGDSVPPRPVIDPELGELVKLSSHTRNIILYGPPGTGKTYFVRKFADQFLEAQAGTPASAEERRTQILQGLNWYQALALTMAVEGEDKTFKVSELHDHSLMRDYANVLD